MREKFCPKCGKKSSKFYNNLCGECYYGKISFIDTLPDRISVGLCKNCGNYYAAMQKFENINEFINERLRELFKKKKILSANYRLEGNIIHVTIISKIDNFEKEEHKNINLVEKKIICNVCNMKNSNYYQSIIQLRGDPDSVKKLLKKIEEKVEEIKKTDDLAFISILEKLKRGINIYIGSKNCARKITSQIKNSYHVKVKVTRKRSGFEKGKSLYKETILVELI